MAAWAGLIGFVGAGGPGDQVYVFIRAQLSGPGAPEVGARDQHAWQDWFARAEPASPNG